MKSLATLIRFKKQQLDELRRKLLGLEAQKQQFLKRGETLAEELRRELQLAGASPEMGAFFGDFADRIKKRQLDIAKEVKKLDRDMDILRDQVRVAFGEIKKFEIVQERRKAEADREENRKETNVLDEVAGMQDRRKKGSNVKRQMSKKQN